MKKYLKIKATINTIAYAAIREITSM